MKIPLTPYRFEEPTTPDACWASSLLWGGRGGYPGDRLAGIPAEVSGRRLGLFSPLLLDALRAGHGLLDLGCGAGTDLHLAADVVGPGGALAGIDADEDLVEIAARHAPAAPRPDLRVGRCAALPWGDRCFDVVNANCVLSLLGDRRRALAEAVRVLQPGGSLVLSDVVRVGSLDPGLVSALGGGGNSAGTAPALADLRADLEVAGLTACSPWVEVLDGPALLRGAREAGFDPGSPAQAIRVTGLVEALADRLALVRLTARKAD